MKNITEKEKHIIDRNLGDEWNDWTGDLEGCEKEINEGRALFFFFYFAALFVLSAGGMLLYYLTAPRLSLISPLLDIAARYTVITVFLLMFTRYFLILITTATGRNFVLLPSGDGLHIEWIYPLVCALAGIFRISKDRMSHSLVKVNNALVYAARKRFKSKNLLVLLPRCFDKGTRLKVMEITKRYGCAVFTATGGSSARNMVKRIKPDAIVGVACERDLVSGMADASRNIAVIAIPNKRPEGPCKNTYIDIPEFEKAVKFFLKK